MSEFKNKTNLIEQIKKVGKEGTGVVIVGNVNWRDFKLPIQKDDWLAIELIEYLSNKKYLDQEDMTVLNVLDICNSIIGQTIYSPAGILSEVEGIADDAVKFLESTECNRSGCNLSNKDILKIPNHVIAWMALLDVMDGQEENKENAVAEAIDEAINLSSTAEFKIDIKRDTHIITIEAQPVQAFADKKGMTYDQFKEAYPNLTDWIETNGWAYSEENDQSRS